MLCLIRLVGPIMNANCVLSFDRFFSFVPDPRKATQVRENPSPLDDPAHVFRVGLITSWIFKRRIV